MAIEQEACPELKSGGIYSMWASAKSINLLNREKLQTQRQVKLLAEVYILNIRNVWWGVTSGMRERENPPYKLLFCPYWKLRAWNPSLSLDTHALHRDEWWQVQRMWIPVLSCLYISIWPLVHREPTQNGSPGTGGVHHLCRLLKYCPSTAKLLHWCPSVAAGFVLEWHQIQSNSILAWKWKSQIISHASQSGDSNAGSSKPLFPAKFFWDWKKYFIKREYCCMLQMCLLLFSDLA